MVGWDERLSKLEHGREAAAEAAMVAKEKEREVQETLLTELLDLAHWAIGKYQSANEPPIPIYIDGRPKEEKPIFGKPRKVFPSRLQAGSGYILYLNHKMGDFTELAGLSFGRDPRAMGRASKILDGVNRIWLATSGDDVLFLSGSAFSSPEDFRGWSQDGTAEWTVNNREVAFKYSGADPQGQIDHQLKRAREAAKQELAAVADRDEFLNSVVRYVGERTTR